MKIKYIRFEVEPREESSNALMGVYEVDYGRGKKKEKRKELLTILHPENKEKADKEIELLKEFHNAKGDITLSGLVDKLLQLQKEHIK